MIQDEADEVAALCCHIILIVALTPHHQSRYTQEQQGVPQLLKALSNMEWNVDEGGSYFIPYPPSKFDIKRQKRRSLLFEGKLLMDLQQTSLPPSTISESRLFQ